MNYLKTLTGHETGSIDDAPAHDGGEYAQPFDHYSVRSIFGHTTFAAEHRDKVVSDLAHGMPGFDVAEYFGNQPTVFADYDFLTLAFDNGGTAIGMVGARWLSAGKRRILYLWTAMLADAYRSTKLYSRMTEQMILTVLRENGGLLPEFIVTKTYNPRVFALLKKYFGRVPGTSVYPRIPGAQADDMGAVANEIAASLWPAMPFDARTAVLRGGQASVSPNFFPRMEECRQPAVDTHFASHLTRSDQIVCIIHVPESASNFIKHARFPSERSTID